MIARYTRPDMGRVWSEENKFRQWLEVELAASEALAEIGEVPADAAQALRAMPARCEPHQRDRSGSAARRNRVHHGCCGEHGRGGTGGLLAVAALWADIE
jgi:adenylosuccinate lyase